MSYEDSGLYLDEMCRAQQDAASMDLALDGATDGYFGNPPSSQEYEYIQAYSKGEERRFAEMKQDMDRFAQRLECASQMLANVRAEFDSATHKVGVGILAATAVMSDAISLDIELKYLRAAIEDEGEF